MIHGEMNIAIPRRLWYYILTHFHTYPLLKILYAVPVSLTGVKVNIPKIENSKITLLLRKYLVRRMLQCSRLFKQVSRGTL